MNQRYQLPLKTRLKLGLKDALQSARYRRKRAALERVETPIAHIHFICYGNICRSAFAEKLAQHLDGGRLTFTSSGLSADQANAPPENAIKAAKTFQADLNGHVPRKTNHEMVAEADIILGMHYAHFIHFTERFPDHANKFYLLKHWALPAQRLHNIHDPFNKPYEAYLRCYRVIYDCIDAMLKRDDLFTTKIH